MMSKDLWFAEMERRLANYEDEGLDFDAAYERAGSEAYDALPDMMADRADMLRQMRKDGAL